MSDPHPCAPFRVRVLTPAEPAIVRVSAPAEPAVIRRVERGDIGPKGEPGRDGGTHTLVIAQDQPASVWTLAHGLRRFPSVTLMDSAGDEFTGSKRYVDDNTIVVTLTAPVSGTAYLN